LEDLGWLEMARRAPVSYEDVTRRNRRRNERELELAAISYLALLSHLSYLTTHFQDKAHLF
jgi:hypothetical protein